MKSPLPAAALAQHVIALGKTGAGKSSAMRLLVEALLDQGQPVTIIDPKGDWWGLKSAADGKRPGYPVVIFGGEHADVPINAHAGAAVAELVATGNRPSLIDLGGWMVGERTRFFIEFASTLFKLTRGARHLVIDEVHNFAPQGKILDPDAGKMLHWANRLASEGRGKGLTILAASQRPQKVHKDFLTSCETLIAMRVIHKLDRDAIKDWIDGCADPAMGKEVLTTLAGMKRGEAWAWSPEIEFGPERVKFPMFSTYDSFKPQAADAGKLKGWAEVDLEEVRKKLAASIEQAQANDPAQLKRRIAELERQVRATPPPASTPGELYAAEKRGRDDGHAAGLLTGHEQGWRDCENAHEAARATVLYDAPPAVPGRIGPSTPVYARLKPGLSPGKYPIKTRLEPAAAAARAAGNGSGVRLPPGEKAVLSACIQFPDGLSRSQLTVLTGYKRSSRDAYIARLREKGYILVNGEMVGATDDGTAALPDAEPLPTGAALRDYWMARLPPGERAILEVLISHYPGDMARGALDEHTEYKRSSRDAYLARLAAKQLVTEQVRGTVRATDALFQ